MIFYNKKYQNYKKKLKWKNKFEKQALENQWLYCAAAESTIKKMRITTAMNNTTTAPLTRWQMASQLTVDLLLCARYTINTAAANILKTGPTSEPVKLLVQGSTGRIGPTTGRTILL